MPTVNLELKTPSELLGEIGRLRAALLNIRALAERGNPIDNTKLAARCRRALAPAQR